MTLTVPISLEAPILYHPETDFQSLDGSMEPDSWIEIPLRSERPIPFKCAVCMILDLFGSGV